MSTTPPTLLTVISDIMYNCLQVKKNALFTLFTTVGLSLASVARAAVNGTSPSAANSTFLNGTCNLCWTHITNFDEITKLSTTVGLSLASFARAAVNGTSPRAANSKAAKAPVAKQISPADIMAKIDALDAENAAYHANMDALIDTTSRPDAPPTHGRFFWTHITNPDEIMKLSMILGLSLASVTMSAVNGTRPRAANSTIAKAPVAKQLSPAEIMAKIDALDAENAAYHAGMDALIDTTSAPDAPPTHGRTATNVHLNEIMQDYITGAVLMLHLPMVVPQPMFISMR
ncbi:hypothetical protein BZA77DRAFT_290699 [Pyronema omphalodes]|nr:hypothetical protein BZA77DRAFT_290699 [Pyronema omphalodes]